MTRDRRCGSYTVFSMKASEMNRKVISILLLATASLSNAALAQVDATFNGMAKVLHCALKLRSM